MERTQQEWGHRGGELTQSGTDIKVGKEPAFCRPPGDPGSPHCPGLRGDWAEQRKAETSDLVESTLKPSGLGSLLLPPGKALDQGNSLKKAGGRTQEYFAIEEETGSCSTLVVRQSNSFESVQI